MIQLNNVNFRYAGITEVEGLNHINITIPDGQVVLVCGQSGCGKTTLTRLINGLIPNFYEGELSGEIFVNGENISKLALYKTAMYVGSVFQNPRTQFFTVDSTSEMAFGCENQGMDKKKIKERIWNTAKHFAMEELLGKSIFQMSGGEKQKVACASVSVSDLPIIVLDEPSSNLDIEATQELRKMIKVWKKEGKTIIIAEHRLHYLMGLLDRIIYMKNGQICAEYSSEDIKQISTKEEMKMGLRPFQLKDFPISFQEMLYEKNIILDNFSFSYNQKVPSLNISKLQIPQNGIIALIGHNGAGKSTLARCLCGLEKKCKGTVSFKGRKYSRKECLKLCYMVMQDVNHQLFTESVEAELLLSMSDSDTEQVKQTLTHLDLESLFDRHPMSLSGGQKQRVAIASALVSEREILVFDEPTSGLDLCHMKEVAGELQELQKSGKTVIVITHDYELIVCCCTHILHLHKGSVEGNYSLDKNGIQRLQNFFMDKR